MSQGNDFANYASAAEDRSSASEDVWFVAVSSDDIKQMTVDQLDEAFRLGVITAQTAVWTEGMEAWAPLGEVADLDSSEEETSGEVPAAPAAFSSAHDDSFAAHNSFAASDAFAAPAPFAAPSSHDSAASQRPAHSGWHNPFEAPTSAPAGREETTHSAVHNSIGPTSFAPVTSSFAPVTSSFAPVTSSFAPVTSSYAPPAGGSLGHGAGPVALNVDEDMPPVNRGRRFRPERWLLAAAGVVAVAVIGFNNKDLFSSASSSVAAAEKQASAAALIARPYEPGADKAASGANAAGSAEATTAPAAVKSAPAADDGDAPIGSLRGEKAENEEASSEEAVPAAAPSSKLGSTGGAKGKEALRGGMAKAFAKGASAGKGAKAEKAEKPARGSKVAKAKSRKPPARAAKGKKGGASRAASAFDPLNGSLP